MIGTRFGRLTIIAQAPSKNGLYWHCQCDCGGRSTVKATSLRYGSTKSCGCGSLEQLRPPTKRHGKAPMHLYWAWKNMRSRCNDPTNHRYSDWGGRGIAVCPEWSDYMTFRDWALAAGWKRGLQIDRRNNEGDYEPAHCHFVTPTVNARNSRKSRFIEHDGRKLTVAEWSEKLGVRPQTLIKRLNRGWSDARTIETPL